MYLFQDDNPVKKKTAHWIHIKVKDIKYPNGIKILSDCKCSACGFLMKMEKEICPHCGAIMSESRE